MELRHLRYFVAVSECSSFTKASARLRIAQPALSRQVRDLEDEIGVNLLKRSSHGVAMTAEGRLFLAEARELLKRLDDSVGKVRELAAGRCGDLHVGYASSFTVELIPAAVASFQKQFPKVNLVLHDVSRDELTAGLECGSLELGVVPVVLSIPGVAVETLRSYPFCVALPPRHPLTRLKSVPLEKVAEQPLVGLRRKDNPGYYQVLDRIFRRLGNKHRVVAQCDTANSLITAIEVGRGIALSIPVFKLVSGQRLIYRPITGVSEVFSIGIARALGGDVTPAGEKFCEILRKIAAESGGGNLRRAPRRKMRQESRPASRSPRKL